MNDNTFDAIVIGAGMSGSWVAKELCDRGIKTLLLERGRDVKHIKDYPTTNMQPWEFKLRGEIPYEIKKENPVISRCYAYREDNQHFFVKDTDHPYIQDKPFDWIRGYHVGGRSLMWGRQSYRLGDLDFEANLKDGVAVDWPIRYKDLAPWYDYVESFIGVSGRKEGLSQLPDGNFLPPMDFNCIEDHVSKNIRKNYSDRIMTIGRTAHITEHRPQFGTRSKCQYRNRCIRGCPYGAYFSSPASTLPAGEASGNMVIRPYSIATEIIYDKETKKAKGVRILDGLTRETKEFYSKIVFVCASAIGSSWLLMNSTSERFPNGLGNDSGELGHNLMDHHFRLGASGETEMFGDKYYKGRRANGI